MTLLLILGVYVFGIVVAICLAALFGVDDAAKWASIVFGVEGVIASPVAIWIWKWRRRRERQKEKKLESSSTKAVAIQAVDDRGVTGASIDQVFAGVAALVPPQSQGSRRIDELLILPPLDAAAIERDRLIRSAWSGVPTNELAENVARAKAYRELPKHANCSGYHISRYLDANVLLSTGKEGEYGGGISGICREVARAFSDEAPIDYVVFVNTQKRGNMPFAHKMLDNMGGLGPANGRPTWVSFDCVAVDGSIVFLELNDQKAVAGRRVVVAECLVIGGRELELLVSLLRHERKCVVVGVAILFDGSGTLGPELQDMRVVRGAFVDLGIHPASFACGKESVPVTYHHY
ncbi:MAG: hypothetical protein HY372_02480 [Candidatus Andersenbacteria bacterium]|nr:hypothetical protein [Candidatus Andersenbacteria bacterium]